MYVRDDTQSRLMHGVATGKLHSRCDGNGGSLIQFADCIIRCYSTCECSLWPLPDHRQASLLPPCIALRRQPLVTQPRPGPVPLRCIGFGGQEEGGAGKEVHENRLTRYRSLNLRWVLGGIFGCLRYWLCVIDRLA